MLCFSSVSIISFSVSIISAFGIDNAGILASKARFKAYASGLLEITSEISQLLITPFLQASINAFKFVPPPDTKTAVFIRLFFIFPPICRVK